MLFRFPPRDLPGRAATGAFILHSGMDKRNGVSARAAGAFPFLMAISPERYLKVSGRRRGPDRGAILLAPFVPNALAGAALTGFSGSLPHARPNASPTPAGQRLADSGRHGGQQGRVDAGHRPRVYSLAQLTAVRRASRPRKVWRSPVLQLT